MAFVAMTPGYVRDLPHMRTQLPVGALLAKYGAVAIPDTFSLRSFEGANLNQGGSGSCGAAGTSQGLQVATNAAGAPLPFVPSPRGIYGATRAIARARATPQGATLPALSDSGVMPADVMTGLAQWGIRPMQGPTPDGRNYDIWTPSDTSDGSSNVNDEPKLEELETSGLKLIAGEYRIDETSTNLVQLVKQSLFVAKAPVGDGTFVDSQVMNFAAGQIVGPPNTSDPNGGGHWTCIVGYRLEANGDTSFDVVNSWGKDYGDEGHFWASSAWLACCTDLYAWTVKR